MDFHSLTRRELQSLCKLNKIPANITNVAMADALQSLDIVVGIEEFLSVSQTDTADVVESGETTVEVSSPKAPQTRCKTSTRQKAKPTETEKLQSTVTRTTCRGSKQLPREVEESKNDLLKTPAVSRTSRKAPATSTRRNVDNQLSECETEAKEECLVQTKYSTRRSTRLTEKKSAAPRVKKGVEKAVKINSVLDQGNSNAEVEDICNVFEKLDVVVMEEKVTHKSGEEDEDCGEANNLKLESDENLKSVEDGDLKDILEISEVKHDDVKPESDGSISSPSEEAIHKGEDSLEISEVKNDDVKPDSDNISIPSEEEDWDDVNNLKQNLEDGLTNSEVINDEVYDLKPDLDDISSPFEDENIVQKLDLGDNFMSAMKEHNHAMVQEEHSLSFDTSSPCGDENLEVKENNFVMDQEENYNCLFASGCGDENWEVKENNFVMDQEENYNCLFAPGVEAALGHEDTACADSEMNNQLAETNDSSTMMSSKITKEMEEMSESVDAIPAIDDHSTMTAEVQDLEPELFTENNVNEKSDTVDETVDADSGSSQNPCISSDVTVHLTHVTPIKKVTSFKNMTEEVKDHKPEFFTETNVNEKPDADLGLTHVTFKKMSSVVSDDKENIVDEKEKKNYNEMSIRQLKKALKALSLNSKDEATAGTTRPALQALRENQMVGGESEN